MKKPVKKSVKVYGSQTSYFVYNPKQKPTIIMIHGLRGDHHGLEFIAKELDKFKVIVPDLPGFGKSTPMGSTHDIEGYAKFVNDFIKSLKLSKPPALVGHSFGSIICAKFAAQHPSKISKLVLINPIAKPPLENSRLGWLANSYYWLGQKLPEKAGTKMLRSRLVIRVMSQSLAKTKNPELLKRVHTQHLKYFSGFHNRVSLGESYQASIKNHVGKWSSELTMPVLLIAGQKDNIAPIESQEKLEKKIAGSTLVTIADTGHLVHYETPKIAGKIISDFILN